MKLAVILMACLAALVLTCPAGRAQSESEYRVKAAFLYNFAKFVEWPSQSFKDPSDSINICVLGEDPFGPLLRDTVNGKTLGGRAFVARDIPDVQQAGGCHILFVSTSEQKRLRPILGNIRAAGVLTVGETEGFARLGGVINFKMEEGKVRFEINVDAAAKGKLQISSKLLGLARIVQN